MNAYTEFLESKSKLSGQYGFEYDGELNPAMFDFQRDIVLWSIRLGSSAIFADCGLGKTIMQLEWSRIITEHTGNPVLIIAPLAVSNQTIREGEKFGIKVEKLTSDVFGSGIYITNYEQIHNVNPDQFCAVVLDESSILKSYSGKYRNQLIKEWGCKQFKLACTATPAPNDHMELGNHSEFLGILKRSEMLSMFFVNDMQTTQKWRLKGHAEKRFWEWVCSWAVMIQKPSDLGYDDNGFKLPELSYHEHIIETNEPLPGMLFEETAKSLTERRLARRTSIGIRSKKVSEIIATKPDEPWLIWCNLNDEADAIESMVDGAIQVAGSHSNDLKTERLNGFTNGDIRVLVTKPKIGGFGMNWQHCSNMIFHGLSDSYEQMYQATRRCWRFGQKNKVNIHIVLTSKEGSVLENIKRKTKDAQTMADEMAKNMSVLSGSIVHNNKRMTKQNHEIELEQAAEWMMYNGDCVEVMKKIETESIGFSIFSPPFAELYTYSDSDLDMGNSKNYDEFFKHFDFLTPEIYRTLKPGRLVSVHCIDIPAMKERDGYIGLKDFPGDIIKHFVSHGFIYHSRVTIWKDPLVEATRTKSLGLMHKQIQKDSSMCRQGLPDYVVTFRKPDTNTEPISHDEGFTEWIGEEEKEPKAYGIKFSHHVWRSYASPVWMDINQSRTLQKTSARADKDEKHICPLQLDTIARCVELWSNPGDTVLSPFAGIGSEGYQALLMKRKFIGIELKRSYFNQAIANLKSASNTLKTKSLFELTN